MFSDFIDLTKELFGYQDTIPLHEPIFIGQEKTYLTNCIDMGYVSSIGKYVEEAEKKVACKAGVDYAIVTVNGTAALHVALLLSGVNHHDEVLTQPLTFIATCNAIAYCLALPVFVDVDIDTMGMSPSSLHNFLSTSTYMKNGECFNQLSGRRIKSCIPMHTFGHPCRIDEIVAICEEYNIEVIQDSAESLGSEYQGKNLGSYSTLSALSFNGNKIVTAGGGGAILTNDRELAKRAKHITTTARKIVDWNYMHDEIAFNYRMPNINAALLCAQLENLDVFLKKKRELASIYDNFFEQKENISFLRQPANSKSNYWLNTIKFKSKKDRDVFLDETNKAGILTRGAWTLMSNLPMFQDAVKVDLTNSSELSNTIVNIPSSVRVP